MKVGRNFVTIGGEELVLAPSTRKGCSLYSARAWAARGSAESRGVHFVSLAERVEAAFQKHRSMNLGQRRDGPVVAAE